MASNICDDNKLDCLFGKKKGESKASNSGVASSTVDKAKVLYQVELKMKQSRIERVCWDPLVSLDWDSAGPPGHLAATRIRRDLSSLFKEPLPGIFAIPDERNLCLVHCLVLGPFETPYEGGFFHFAVRFGPSYPIHPPRVKLMTTDGGRVRFNPNLYANGKVCLSILGTWSGPVWSPALNLGSLLLSIQSLLNEKPYFNEPGFKTENFRGESDRYNCLITHETLRVAVCRQMEEILSPKERQSLPPELADVIKESFLDLYDDYVETCNKYVHLDGQKMTDPLFHVKREYNFHSLLERLKKLREKLESLPPAEEKDGRESSLSSISDEELGKREETNSMNTEQEGSQLAQEGNESVEASGSASKEEYTIDDDIQLLMGDDDDEEEGEEEEEGE